MAAGGKMKDTRGPGILVELPDGSTVFYYPKSRSGGPAIDVVFPGTKFGPKVHVSPWPSVD